MVNNSVRFKINTSSCCDFYEHLSKLICKTALFYDTVQGALNLVLENVRKVYVCLILEYLDYHTKFLYEYTNIIFFLNFDRIKESLK